MFTGIVEGIGKVVSTKRRDYTATYEFDVDFDLGSSNVGDSISVDGCCLTVTSRLGNHFWADISDETLRISTLGSLKEGSRVNIERAMKMGGRLDGHLVQGHIDGVGKIKSFQSVENGKEIEIQVPGRLKKYIVEKGSIAVSGISLTINSIKEDIFLIRVIPHTLDATTLKDKKVGEHVNLEVDIVGKYVEKLRFSTSGGEEEESKITDEFLKKHGF